MRDGFDEALADLPPKCRLHISQLNPDVNKTNLKEKFGKHGRIFEVYVNNSKGFGFIQYGNPEDAASAIIAEHQTVFEGNHIGVTLAMRNRFGQTLSQDDSSRELNNRGPDQFMDRDREMSRFREHDLPPLVRDRSPLHDRYDDRILDRYDRHREPYERDREDTIRRRDPYYEDRMPPPRDRYEERFLAEDDFRRDAAYRDRDRDRDRREPLDHGREPLDRGREPLDRGREPLDRGREPLDRGREPLDRGREPLDRAREPLDRAREPLDRAREPLDRAREPLDRAREPLKRGRESLDHGREPLDRGREPLDRGRRDILDREKDPRDARDVYDRRVPRLTEPLLSDPAGPSTVPPPLPPTDTPIDCEILLMGKHLRDYADLVERRLKVMALNTGLLLISNEGSLSQALEDVACRKVLYAIIISTQNELHRSVTLNILHGSPQEHRNMPLEDALALVDRNFSTYLQDQAVPSKIASSSVPPVVPAPLPGEPPLPRSQPPLPPAPPKAPVPQTPALALAVPAVELTIPQLINLLADRKQLTLSEMDRVITHLQAVRRKMAIEQGLNPEPPSVTVAAAATGITQNAQQKPVSAAVAPTKEIDKKQAELQAKILSIFNPPGSSSTASTSTETTVATKIILGKHPLLVPKPNTAIPFSYGGSLSTINKTPQAANTTLSNLQTKRGGSNINLDSPVVQKVLDKLIQSGPTMLKQLATSANMTSSSSTLSKTQASNKVIKDLKNRLSGTTPKLPTISKEQSDAQLRAAQNAALQTLQQQETATRTLQTQMGQQNQTAQPAVQNQHQQQLVQYPQSAQYQQQQTAYQQQPAPYQQQQAPYQQQQYQSQQAGISGVGVGPRSVVGGGMNSDIRPSMGSSMTNSRGSGWPRGWNRPGTQQIGSKLGPQPGLQYPTPNPNMKPNPRPFYPQQSAPRMDSRPQSVSRSQPKPPGI